MQDCRNSQCNNPGDQTDQQHGGAGEHQREIPTRLVGPHSPSDRQYDPAEEDADPAEPQQRSEVPVSSHGAIVVTTAAIVQGYWHDSSARVSARPASGPGQKSPAARWIATHVAGLLPVRRGRGISWFGPMPRTPCASAVRRHQPAGRSTWQASSYSSSRRNVWSR